MVSIFSLFYFTFFHYAFYLRNVTSSHLYSVCEKFFFQLRFRNIDNPIFWIYMTTNLCAYLLTQTPECTWFYNATRDEQWKAKTFADEQQITLFGPVSIEKICLVEGQVKDTLNNHSNFQKSRHATRLIFIQSTKLHAVVHVEICNAE